MTAHSSSVTPQTLASALARLSSLSIVLDGFDSNEDFSKDGGWINGTLDIGGETVAVGGGWVLSDESADHWNNCHGYSYSGGGPNPFREAKSAGDFNAYTGTELGRVERVCELLGIDPNDREAWAEIAEKLTEMSEKAWADYDTSDSVEWCALTNGGDAIVQNLREAIDSDDKNEAKHWAKVAKRKGLVASVEDISEDLDSQLDDSQPETLWSTVTRKLVLTGNVETLGEVLGLHDSEDIAEWTICAVGHYDERGDWDTEEDTSGGDGVKSGLEGALDAFSLLDDAKELPEVTEPDEAPECEEENASFAVEVRNTYTQGMESFERKAFFAEREHAEAWERKFWRDFTGANGANAYGPETRIVERDGDDWNVTEGDE